VDNGVGLFERKPAAIAEILERWLMHNKAEFSSFAKRAREIGSKWKGALYRIVIDLAIMCDSTLESGCSGCTCELHCKLKHMRRSGSMPFQRGISQLHSVGR
jgi:hypothetical protein